MQKIVHSLTMLLVLNHLLVGCCSHHGHAESIAMHSMECGCHGDEEHQESSDSPRPRDGGCGEGNCYFVVPQTDGGAELVDRSAPVNGLCGLLPNQGYAFRTNLASIEDSPPCGVPPLRLHLANQVLLI